MGEWIEIEDLRKMAENAKVSPFMGEWIEIASSCFVPTSTKESHPSWVSGLKDEPDLIKREVGFLHAFSQPFI
ncbi:Uncharacterised protein [Streptococcus pyogenes]|nr:hypothetical protein [Streptococcus pyogenes]VHA72155.1 Uncharacterised protein [Streptococcus pyogenes]